MLKALKKENTTYFTDCPDGMCILKIKQIKNKSYTKPDGKPSKKFACKEHGGFVVKRKTTCLYCGEPHWQGPDGQAKHFCNQRCRYHWHKENPPIKDGFKPIIPCKTLNRFIKNNFMQHSEYKKAS